jgi:nicotinate-nucleotide adenylyltransferase
MQFFRRASGNPGQLGIFPGSFNPLTTAHVSLARSALRTVDEVVFVLPRNFPHKDYRDTSLEQRVALLLAGLDAEPRFSIAVSDGGLFVEIARDCRQVYGERVRLSFLCGRDAAQRVAAWDYGRPGAWQEMLQEFDLLVAPRDGEFQPEPGQLGSFGEIPLAPECQSVSATEVRRRIAAGESWEELVPEATRALVRKFYGAGNPTG